MLERPRYDDCSEETGTFAACFLSHRALLAVFIAAAVMDRVKYGLARKLYGEYPPHSTLNYVWANIGGQGRIITSPYTDRAKLIALKKGAEKTGTWQLEEVDILRDYRAAFGADPPPVATIAIMNDSDDTGQGSVSYVDFIEVFKDGG